MPNEVQLKVVDSALMVHPAETSEVLRHETPRLAALRRKLIHKLAHTGALTCLALLANPRLTEISPHTWIAVTTASGSQVGLTCAIEVHLLFRSNYNYL